MSTGLFRVARPASGRWNLAKSLAQMLVLWAVFIFLIPSAMVSVLGHYGISARPSVAGHIIGAALFLLGSTGAVWSVASMAMIGRGTPLPLDCARTLVVTGPYRYIRNPMAAAALAQFVGMAMWLGSWPVMVYALIGESMWNWVLRPMEERDLVQRFGADYEAYRQAVPCWWITFPGYDPR